MNEKEYVVDTPADFTSVIAAVLEKARTITKRATLVALSGDLGAGKTTFTQVLATDLGVTEPVVSPTFGIMKVYELENDSDFDHLIHIDAYRIADISEVGPLRLEELFGTPRTLICLEWPENISAILPEDALWVNIAIGEGEQRKVTITPNKEQ